MRKQATLITRIVIIKGLKPITNNKTTGLLFVIYPIKQNNPRNHRRQRGRLTSDLCHLYRQKLREFVFASKTRTARQTKLILFLKENAYPPQETVATCALNTRQLERSRETVAVRCNLTIPTISEKYFEVSKGQSVQESEKTKVT